MFTIEGPTSPFFAFYTFVLLAASLRWDWQGIVLTVTILAFLLMTESISNLTIGNADSNDLNKRLIQGAYLIAAGGMFAFVSALLERVRERLAKLAAWPGDEFLEEDSPTAGNEPCLYCDCVGSSTCPRGVGRKRRATRQSCLVAAQHISAYPRNRRGVRPSGPSRSREFCLPNRRCVERLPGKTEQSRTNTRMYQRRFEKRLFHSQCSHRAL